MNSSERSVSDAGSAPSVAWVVGNLDAVLRGYGPLLKGIGLGLAPLGSLAGADRRGTSYRSSCDFGRQPSVTMRNPHSACPRHLQHPR